METLHPIGLHIFIWREVTHYDSSFMPFLKKKYFEQVFIPCNDLTSVRLKDKPEFEEILDHNLFNIKTQTASSTRKKNGNLQIVSLLNSVTITEFRSKLSRLP